MCYEEAFILKHGDTVIVADTGMPYTVESISGTLTHIFVLLNNGRDYRHDQLDRPAVVSDRT